MKDALLIIIALAALACGGCTTPSHIQHETLNESGRVVARTNVWVGATFLSDRKLGPSAYIHKPDGTVAVLMASYSNTVNEKTIVAGFKGLGQAVLAVITGGAL